MLRVIVGLAFILCVLPAAAAPPKTIAFPGVGAHGVFDPSLEASGDRLWMSYSAVEAPAATPCPSNIERVETRIAYSDDHGANWRDAGLVVEARPECLPEPNRVGVRVSEVSTLVRDATAPAAKRWKLLSHRYLWVRDAARSNRRFEDGWIAMREARTVTALASAAEQRLFVGAAYAGGGGPSLVRVNRLHPDLAECLALTEPGALATQTGLYVAVGCNGRFGAKLVLLRQRDGWHYVGTIASGVTAPELFLARGRAYVLVTPTQGGRYAGCRVNAIDLATARLGKRLMTIAGSTGNFNGACGWDPRADRSGILLSERRSDPGYQIVRTGKRYPR